MSNISFAQKGIRQILGRDVELEEGKWFETEPYDFCYDADVDAEKLDDAGFRVAVEQGTEPQSGCRLIIKIPRR